MSRSALCILSRISVGLGTALLSPISWGASLTLVAELPGRDFDLSHEGKRFAAFDGNSVCLYSVADPEVGKKCFVVPINPNRAVPQVRWAPDDSSLAVSGDDFADTPGIWILSLTGPNSEPVRIHTGRPPGPGSGGDAVVGFLNAGQLLMSGRYGGYGIFDIETGARSGCQWGETDGRRQWFQEHGLVVGTNRFGDIQVAKAIGGPDDTTLSCIPVRRAESTLGGIVWYQFEAILAPDMLLFSQQIYDAGQSWEIGGRLVALNAMTLQFVAEYPPGAPASVSPQGDLVAAVRGESDERMQFVVYRISDRLPILELPSTNPPPAPLTDSEWATLQPKWSLEGEYVLFVENDLMTAQAELMSIAERKIDPVLRGIPRVLDADWTTSDRLIVSCLFDGIRVYELVRQGH